MSEPLDAYKRGDVVMVDVSPIKHKHAWVKATVRDVSRVNGRPRLIAEYETTVTKAWRVFATVVASKVRRPGDALPESVI